MFYFHEILKKRGKFGIIWLAATAPKRLNKREISAVDVSKRSKEVEELLTRYPSIAGRRNVHLSLYLSSQLMYGLVFINNCQSDIIFEEVKALAARIGSFRRVVSSNTELEEPVTGFRVTIDEPDFDNAPIDFGSFSIVDIPHTPLPSLEYFVVSTPRSSEEGWHISPGYPEELRAPLVDIGEEHLARSEDITMPEDIIPTREKTTEVMQQEDEVFLTDIPFFTSPPLHPGDVYQPDQVIVPDSVEHPPSLPRITDTASQEELDVTTTQPQPSILEAPLPIIEDQITIPDLRTPDIPITVSEPVQRRESTVTERDTTLPPPPRPDRRTRRSLFGESEASFILDPAPARTGRGRKQRHLIIDHAITLTPAQISHNIASANTNLVRPMELPCLAESPESMFNRFGLRAAARGSKRFWRKLRTLPEPDDPAKFGFFEEPKVLDGVLAEAAVQDITTESREELREEHRTDTLDEQNVTTLRSTFLSSQYFQETQDQTLGTGISSLQVPDITGISEAELPSMKDILGESAEPVVMEPLAMEEMREPEVLIDKTGEFEMPPEEITPLPREEITPLPQEEITPLPQEEITPFDSRPSQVCVVSPERTPPPPSPEIPKSPLIDKAVFLIKEVFDESPVATSITFSSVIRKTPGKRAYVAKFLNLLLSLHASSVIYIEQSEPYGEIFISKGPNFNAFV